MAAERLPWRPMVFFTSFVDTDEEREGRKIRHTSYVSYSFYNWWSQSSYNWQQCEAVSGWYTLGKKWSNIFMCYFPSCNVRSFAWPLQTTPTFVIICIPWKHLFALEYFQTFKIVFRGFGTANGAIAVAIDDVQVKAQFCPTLPKYAEPGIDAFPNRKESTPSTQTWSHYLRFSVS